MIFDADISVWQGPHFMAGFVHEVIVFWAAFFDPGFASAGAMGIEVSGDGQEHFTNHC